MVVWLIGGVRSSDGVRAYSGKQVAWLLHLEKPEFGRT